MTNQFYTYSIYTEYFVFFLFFFIGLMLSLILFFLVKLISTGTSIPDFEKIESYECGFDPIKDSRQLVDLKFYKVSILFIIFDIEVIFLFPWCSTLLNLDLFSIIYSYYFILILSFGLYLELNSKCIRW